MKTKDIAAKYGIDLETFHQWLPTSGFAWSAGMLSNQVLEDDIDAVVEKFKYDHSPEAAQALQEKQKVLANILITSGFSFDGFTITKYSGYVSGDDVVQVPRGQGGFWGGGATDPGTALMTALVVIRRNALNELKEAAYALGCNAVIGVDFDYITLEPETVNNQGGTLYMPYVFGVTANGNAVTIEKNNK